MKGFHSNYSPKSRELHKPIEPRSLVEYVTEAGHDLHGTVAAGLRFKALCEHQTVIEKSKRRYLYDQPFEDVCDAVVKALPLEARLVNQEVGERLYVWDHGVAVLLYWGRKSAASKLIITSTNADEIKPAIEAFTGMTREQPKQGSVGILMRPNPKEGLTVRHIGVGGKPLITHNYMPNVVEGFNAICDDLRRSQPHGRLFVLEGPPGTGKTFLIRALMDAVIARFILIQPKLMAELSDPEVLLTFVNDEIQTIEDACDPTPDPPVVLVCEDADTMLAKRSDQHGSLVSVLNALAIGDGIIGELLDIRLIATTNVEVGDLDPAILRPGRLSHRLIVGALNHDQARKVWRELVGDLPLPKRKDDYTLAELYALARGACTPPGQGSLSIDHSTPQDAPERLSSIEDDPSVV